MSQKRSQFGAEFKLEVVLEGLRGEKSIEEICRERNIEAILYHEWHQQFLTRAPKIFSDDIWRQVGDETETATRIADLEEKMKRLKLENKILKIAQSWSSMPSKMKG